MKKLILSGLMALIGASAAIAQTDYNKTEFFVGYSNNQVDTGANSGNDVRSFFNDRRSFNGFEGSGVYNVSRYFGVKGDISGAYRKQKVDTVAFNNNGTVGKVSFDANRSLYNFLGGVQVKDNASTARLKPFAHALIGAAHQRIETKGVVCQGVETCPPAFTGKFSDTGIAGAIGGGLDVKVNDKIDIRAIQVDYNPARLNDRTQHNFRFGIGIVIK